MHQTKKKISWCTSRGPHVLKLANVMTNPCLMWPHYISYVLKLPPPAYQKHAWLPSHGRWRGRRARHRAFEP